MRPKEKMSLVQENEENNERAPQEYKHKLVKTVRSENILIRQN